MAEVTKRHESGHSETHPVAFWEGLQTNHPDIAALYTQVGPAKNISTPPEVVPASARKPATEPKKAE